VQRTGLIGGLDVGFKRKTNIENNTTHWKLSDWKFGITNSLEEKWVEK
jgi:hypothetical protein